MIQSVVTLASWVVFMAVVARVVWLAYAGRNPLSVGRTLTRLSVVTGMLIVALAVDFAYSAPLAIIQDIVAAEDALRGEPLPAAITREALEAETTKEPRPAALGKLWRKLDQEEATELATIPDKIHVQAHPPVMTLVTLPFVRFLGVHKTSLCVTLLSLVCFAVLWLLILRDGLNLALPHQQQILIAAVLLGSLPAYAVLRNGQTGAWLAALIVVGWYAIRRGKPVWGGVAIGLATSLKLFPGLLLVYLLLRHRRAFLSAVVSTILLNLVALLAFGWESFLSYLEAAHLVVTRNAGVTLNWSLLGGLQHLGRLTGLSFLTSTPAFLGLAGVVLILLGVAVGTSDKESPPGTRFDLEYSLFVIAMPLLSPIAWFHYYIILALPLVVLASAAFRDRKPPLGVLLFASCCVALGLHPGFVVVLSPILQQWRWRLGGALPLLPTSALVVTTAWIWWLAVRPRPSTADPHHRWPWPGSRPVSRWRRRVR